MNRMDRLEEAVEKYVDERGNAALKKAVVPGLDEQKDSKNQSEGSKTSQGTKRH